jgi:tRNA(fMet)-specific endonuclease VapC
MAYLLDTNVFIALIVRDDRAIRRRFQVHRRDVVLSAIVLHELYFGAYDSVRRQEALDVIRQTELPILDFDAEDARAAAEIRAGLKRKGTPIGPYDVLISGQAMARGLIVVTANKGEFERVDGLKVEDWTADE